MVLFHPSLPPFLCLAHARQVLELLLLQIHLCVWGDERAGSMGTAGLGAVVRSDWLPNAHLTAMQRPLSICEHYCNFNFSGSVC